MAGGIAQDDARENRLIDLFNLYQTDDRVRHGTDAILELDGKRATSHDTVDGAGPT